MSFEALKVGELAQRTGLTVRTLHHYDAIGLLRPSLHTEAGYRLYTAGDIGRLQQVISLRQLASVGRGRDRLDRPGLPAAGGDRAPSECTGNKSNRNGDCANGSRLWRFACVRRGSGPASTEFLSTIEEMSMLETLQAKYFTPEQMQAIKQGREQAGPENLNRMQEYWVELIALIRTEMDKGTDPADPKVQELTRRWQELLTQSTGGDPGIKQGMKQIWEEQETFLLNSSGSGR